jgi:hypothetical protein
MMSIYGDYYDQQLDCCNMQLTMMSSLSHVVLISELSVAVELAVLQLRRALKIGSRVQ